jgi:hypothetical protein
MRPTGPGHGAYKDDPDFVVYSGAWQIGRIYERRGFPDHVRWVWSLYGVVLTRPTHTGRYSFDDVMPSIPAGP